MGLSVETSNKNCVTATELINLMSNARTYLTQFQQSPLTNHPCYDTANEIVDTMYNCATPTNSKFDLFTMDGVTYSITPAASLLAFSENPDNIETLTAIIHATDVILRGLANPAVAETDLNKKFGAFMIVALILNASKGCLTDAGAALNGTNVLIEYTSDEDFPLTEANRLECCFRNVKFPGNGYTLDCDDILFASTCFYLLKGKMVKCQWTGFEGSCLPKICAQGFDKLVKPGIYKRYSKRHCPIFVSECDTSGVRVMMECGAPVQTDGKSCDSPKSKKKCKKKDSWKDYSDCDNSSSSSSSDWRSSSRHHGRRIRLMSKKICKRCGFKRCACPGKLRL
jgi:hypothetical protein